MNETDRKNIKNKIISELMSSPKIDSLYQSLEGRNGLAIKSLHSYLMTLGLVFIAGFLNFSLLMTENNFPQFLSFATTLFTFFAAISLLYTMSVSSNYKKTKRSVIEMIKPLIMKNYLNYFKENPEMYKNEIFEKFINYEKNNYRYDDKKEIYNNIFKNIEINIYKEICSIYNKPESNSISIKKIIIQDALIKDLEKKYLK